MSGLLPEIYQFRIWLKGISPMIWRRFLVKANTSIEDLHYRVHHKKVVYKMNIVFLVDYLS